MSCVKDAILLLETGIFFQTVTFGITLHYSSYQLLACQSSFLEMMFVNIHIVFPVYLPQLITPTADGGPSPKPGSVRGFFLLKMSVLSLFPSACSKLLGFTLSVLL